MVSGTLRQLQMASHWAGVSSGGREEEEEEGEVVESGDDTSDDDYSPGSLVIDAKEDGGTCTLCTCTIEHNWFDESDFCYVQL